MASVLAEGVVGKVCEMAVQQVTNEVSLLVNFADDFERLKHRIAEINCFLNEADEERRSRQKESVKKWLKRVRDIAWEAEDILEECAVESMYGHITQSCTLSCNQLILRHNMGRRIKNVKARMSSTVEEGNQLRIAHSLVSPVEEGASSSTSQREQWKRCSRLPSDSHPVGTQSKVESIVSLLDNPAHPIIAVVGMGGIGKTYLIQHVFNNAKERYERSVWISVSQFYSISKLQCDLAFQLGLSEQIKGTGVSEQVVEDLIYRSLQGIRCLIVLDDVWRATREDNLIARLGLPTGNNSPCKIVVTTRSRDVCVNLNAEIYNMECLTEEESWRLFCAYAFRNIEGNTPPKHLQEVAHGIVKECGNLPLAIETIGASLSSTTHHSRWQSKLRQLKQVALVNDPIMDILKLSYDSLPARLKACFAYLSFFPEDENIKCEYLINLWVGEGFIPAGEEQWDMSWDCLYRLANLCLVQLWEDRFLHKYCKVHDLLLDLAINISRENKCAFTVEEAFNKIPSMDRSDGCSRILLGKKNIDDIAQSRLVSPRHLRTISLCENPIRSIPASLFSSMSVVRVLDLSSTGISTLPKCVGKMKLLKVLNLSWRMTEVPKCVRHLKSLSFLKISHRRDELWHRLELPVWISELRCLQHLECPFQRMPEGTSKLLSLRTLRSGFHLELSSEEDGFLRWENVGKMSELEEVWLDVKHESELKRMEELRHLVNMRHLHISNGIVGDTERALPIFPESMREMKDLEELQLRNFAVPSWICCMANLRKLSLLYCHCTNYPELQTLSNLVSLFLFGNARCRELPKVFGKSGGFPHLRFMFIYNFFELEEFPELENGAMACLEELGVRRCPSVKKVGEGLGRLKRLKVLRLHDTGRDEVRERLKEGGEYLRKIKDMNAQVIIEYL